MLPNEDDKYPDLPPDQQKAADNADKELAKEDEHIDVLSIAVPLVSSATRSKSADGWHQASNLIKIDQKKIAENKRRYCEEQKAEVKPQMEYISQILIDAIIPIKGAIDEYTKFEVIIFDNKVSVKWSKRVGVNKDMHIAGYKDEIC